MSDKIVENSSCCGKPSIQPENKPCISSAEESVTDKEQLQPDMVPQVATQLRFSDRLGGWKARWGIGRMHYIIKPGLYRVGEPTSESPVFVTANYKMSFDHLRSQLSEINSRILVLDTKGVNVWCAAGKGTFGTDELVRRIEGSRLRDVVNHKKLIVPQLGATGVSAHKVKEFSGYKVIFGPVRTADIPEFLSARMKTTPEMRKVRFDFIDRLIMVPMEITGSVKYLLLIAACFFILSGLNSRGYSSVDAGVIGVKSIIVLVAAYLSATVFFPLLLPYLPGRAFSFKGASIGLAAIAGLAILAQGIFDNWLTGIAWFLMVPAVASFLAMNFTGATTFTSLSGVRKEIRTALPLQIAGSSAGMVIWLISRFI